MQKGIVLAGKDQGGSDSTPMNLSTVQIVRSEIDQGFVGFPNECSYP